MIEHAALRFRDRVPGTDRRVLCQGGGPRGHQEPAQSPLGEASSAIAGCTMQVRSVQWLMPATSNGVGPNATIGGSANAVAMSTGSRPFEVAGWHVTRCELRQLALQTLYLEPAGVSRDEVRQGPKQRNRRST